MENYITICIISVIIVFAFNSSIKHFKGESGCCGGGSYKPKKKKLKNIKYQKTFKIGGMHCENCKRRVEEIVNEIQGISGKVDLKKGELTVSYAESISDDFIKMKIEKARYTVD